MLTARRNKRKISMEELEDAVERVIAGPEKKSRTISDLRRNWSLIMKPVMLLWRNCCPIQIPCIRFQLYPGDGQVVIPCCCPRKIAAT